MKKVLNLSLICLPLFFSCSSQKGRTVQSTSPFVEMCKNKNSPKEIKKTIGYLKRMVTKTFSSKNVDVKSEYHMDYQFPRYEFSEKELYDYNKVEAVLINEFNNGAISCEKTRQKLAKLKALEMATVPPNKIAMDRLDRSTWTIKGITDISPLAEFTNLEYLHIGQNSIRSLEPLRGMKNLKVLKAGKNDIEDISALADLKELRVVELFENMITDITPLKNLDQLEYLSVFGNFLGSLIKPKRMSHSEKKSQQQKNLGTFNELESLVFLGASQNGFTSMAYFTNAPSLKYLNLGNNRIKKVDNLRKMKTLKYLVLKKNKITDIEPLKNLNNLMSLKLSGDDMKIKCWTPLRDLEKLNRSAYFTIHHRIGGIANVEKDGIEQGDEYTCIKCGNLNKYKSPLIRQKCRGLGKYSPYFCEKRPFKFCKKRTCESKCREKFSARRDKAVCRRECKKFIEGMEKEVPRLMRVRNVTRAQATPTAKINVTRRLRAHKNLSDFFMGIMDGCGKVSNLGCE